VTVWAVPEKKDSRKKNFLQWKNAGFYRDTEKNPGETITKKSGS
jgi:hypothetical protein